MEQQLRGRSLLAAARPKQDLSAAMIVGEREGNGPNPASLDEPINCCKAGFL